MKKIILLLSLCLFIFGCSGNLTDSKENNTETNKSNNQIESFRGEITNIKTEKDGYTITLKNNENETVKSVISIANLGQESNFNFDNIEVGNELLVSGDSFLINKEKNITTKNIITIFSKSEEKTCLEKKGNYQKLGKLQSFQCNTNTKDFDKECNDSSECEGYCQSKTKSCSEKTINFGCLDMLENGKEVTLCID